VAQGVRLGNPWLLVGGAGVEGLTTVVKVG